MLPAKPSSLLHSSGLPSSRGGITILTNALDELPNLPNPISIINLLPPQGGQYQYAFDIQEFIFRIKGITTANVYSYEI